MNLQQYIEKWSGKKVDFDGHYGYQCVDLVRSFCREVLWVSLWPSGGSAKTMWANKHGTFNNKWKKVVNNPKDPKQVPAPWDIIFWIGWKYSKWGHVWIVDEWFLWANKIDILDQNNGTGNWDGMGKNSIWVRQYTYDNIAGWFTYLPAQVETEKSESTEDLKAIISDLQKKLESETGFRKQYERENGILRRRSAEAIATLTGE